MLIIKTMKFFQIPKLEGIIVRINTIKCNTLQEHNIYYVIL